MSSARDVTAAVNPPRATFLDWPLGHTSGRPGQSSLNLDVMRATLAAFETIHSPGTIVDLPFPWANDDDWKNQVLRSRPRAAGESSGSADSRVSRLPTPQYQTVDDEAAAVACHDGTDCVVCAGIDY